MKKLFAVLLSAAFVFLGCAHEAPSWVDPGVYRASRGVKIEKHKSEKKYYQVQADSYKAGTGGKVTEVGEKPVAPGIYHQVWLMNKLDVAVDFVINGKVAVSETLPAAIQSLDPAGGLIPVGKQIALQPDAIYHVRIWRTGNEYAFKDGCVEVNRKTGDAIISLVPVEKREEALKVQRQEGKDPTPDKITCDFFIAAP